RDCSPVRAAKDRTDGIARRCECSRGLADPVRRTEVETSLGARSRLLSASCASLFPFRVESHSTNINLNEEGPQRKGPLGLSGPCYHQKPFFSFRSGQRSARRTIGSNIYRCRRKPHQSKNDMICPRAP